MFDKVRFIRHHGVYSADPFHVFASKHFEGLYRVPPTSSYDRRGHRKFMSMLFLCLISNIFLSHVKLIADDEGCCNWKRMDRITDIPTCYHV